MDAEELDPLLSESQWLHRLARRLVSADQADDVVQETMLSTLGHPPPESRRLRPWLAQVARNVVRMRYRGDQRRARREDSFAREDAGDSPSSAELLDRVRIQRMLAEHLLELAEPYRSALLLRFFDDKTSMEIASALGIADSTVRWRIKRGVEILRERLEAKEGPRWSVALLTFPPASLPAGSAKPSAPSAGAVPKGILMTKKLATILVLLLSCLGVGALAWRWWPADAPSDATAESAIAEKPGVDVVVQPAIDERSAGPSRPARLQRLLTALQKVHPQLSEPQPTRAIAMAANSDVENALQRGAYVNRQVKSFMPLLEQCYESARKQSPGLAGGKVVIALAIIADADLGGLVEESHVVDDKSTLAHAELSECIAETLYALELEPPHVSGRMTYEKTLYFGIEASDEHTDAPRGSVKKVTQEIENASTEPAESNERASAEVERCDEVTCLVHPERACCARLERHR